MDREACRAETQPRLDHIPIYACCVKNWTRRSADKKDDGKLELTLEVDVGVEFNYRRISLAQQEGPNSKDQAIT